MLYSFLCGRRMHSPLNCFYIAIDFICRQRNLFPQVPRARGHIGYTFLFFFYVERLLADGSFVGLDFS